MNKNNVGDRWLAKEPGNLQMSLLPAAAAATAAAAGDAMQSASFPQDVVLMLTAVLHQMQVYNFYCILCKMLRLAPVLYTSRVTCVISKHKFSEVLLPHLAR